MKSDRRVVITGTGVVTPFGVGQERFWENLKAGSSGAQLIDTFDVSGLPTRFAAPVPHDENEINAFIDNKKSIKTMSRAARFAVIATKEAVEEAGLETDRLDPYRFGTSIGAGGLGSWDLEHSNKTIQIVSESLDPNSSDFVDFGRVWRNTLDGMHPLSPLKSLSNIPTAHIAINYNARGNCQTITTACTSSAQAIGEAYRQIKYGVADVMSAGGSDSMVNPYGMVAFSMLGVISKNNEEFRTAARPFDRRRDGFMIGEGAAIFILEEYEHCKKRGAEPYVEIIGYASTCDAFRLTDEPAEAWGSVEAMKLALADAQINPAHVDYINAHGTSTTMNDKTETYAIKKVFGEHAYSIPVSSTKSMIGHLIAAAGAAELSACTLAMKHQIIPPTINYQEPDPNCDLDYVPNHAREAKLEVILSNSFGFGGQNACLVLKRV
ncbi:MAG: beta-ketoacyl-[acyl-carrier-protein] synthase family protein [bacterium]